MEQRNKLEDLQSMRFLSVEDKKELQDLESQLACLSEPEPARGDFTIFMDKRFNEAKSEFPNLKTDKINHYLKNTWAQMSAEQKTVFAELAVKEATERKERINELYKRRQQICEQIHKLKYGSEVQQILKPSGKLKFLSAFRVYRRVNINRVKEAFPQMENKGRHEIVKQMWKRVSESERLIYVLRSRADKERALY